MRMGSLNKFNSYRIVLDFKTLLLLMFLAKENQKHELLQQKTQLEKPNNKEY